MPFHYLLKSHHNQPTISTIFQMQAKDQKSNSQEPQTQNKRYLEMERNRGVRANAPLTSTQSPEVFNSFRNDIVVELHNDSSLEFFSNTYVQETPRSHHLLLSSSLIFSSSLHRFQRFLFFEEETQENKTTLVPSRAIYLQFEIKARSLASLERPCSQFCLLWSYCLPCNM